MNKSFLWFRLVPGVHCTHHPLMKGCLKHLILLTVGGWLASPAHSAAQQTTPPHLVTQTRTARSVNESEELQASEALMPIPSQGTNFQERLSEIIRKANNQPHNHENPEQSPNSNYQIKIEYLTGGKPWSGSRTEPHFNLLNP